MAEEFELTIKVSARKVRDSPVTELRRPYWDGITDLQREAVLYLVRDGLVDLIGRVEKWVPSSFTADNGDHLHVDLGFEVDVVDKMVLCQQVLADQALDDARSEVRRMQERFHG